MNLEKKATTTYFTYMAGGQAGKRLVPCMRGLAQWSGDDEKSAKQGYSLIEANTLIPFHSRSRAGRLNNI